MDKYKLEYVMKTKGVTVEKLCGELGISKSAYYRKCNGKSEFTRSEIQKIVKILELNSPVDIFFNDKVS